VVSGPSPLDVVGIGSMVADRLHRIPRALRADEKAILRALPGGRTEQTFVGGVVLNHLGWAAALGLRTGIFGRQADDQDGRFLRGAMDRHGIEHHLVLDGSASSFAHIFVDDDGGRAIYMAPGATAETTAQHIRECHAEFIRRAARVTTEVSQLPLEAVREVQRVAREAGIPNLVDLDVPPSDAVPALGDEDDLREVLQAADVLKPGKAAARALLGGGDDALALARGLRERFGSRAVVVTDGAAGCAIAAQGASLRVPGVVARAVVDTTGAGDAFLGGLLMGLQLGFDWEAAGRLANACGAACVEKLGAFPDGAAAARARVLELWDGPALRLPAPAPPRVGREALASLDVCLAELAGLRRRQSAEAFERVVELVREAEGRGGRVHVTGIGKPQHVAQYAASLLSSVGTPATFLHGTEVVHGSAGQVVAADVVIAISNSGETRELREAVEAVRRLGARIVAVTGNPGSWLAKNADAVLEAGVAHEGGGLGFAPRASVAAQVLVLAALSAALEEARGLTPDEYHARHPSGALGEKSQL
jgi:arabinose-5-phosphate isomerase